MEKIILDCDPGHDDAIAILLAAANPAIDLLGITTVSGNHNVDNTTRNALATCTAYGIKVPVAEGSTRPIIIDQVLAADIVFSSNWPVTMIGLDLTQTQALGLGSADQACCRKIFT